MITATSPHVRVLPADAPHKGNACELAFLGTAFAARQRDLSATQRDGGAAYATKAVACPVKIQFDGCIPSDLGTGTTAELEEERRLLYVAMTRAKNDLHLIVPQRFFTHGQSAQGDRHVYASRTRFIPNSLLGLFEKTAWPAVATSPAAAAPIQGAKVDIGARMRRMWQ